MLKLLARCGAALLALALIWSGAALAQTTNPVAINNSGWTSLGVGPLTVSSLGPEWPNVYLVQSATASCSGLSASITGEPLRDRRFFGEATAVCAKSIAAAATVIVTAPDMGASNAIRPDSNGQILSQNAYLLSNQSPKLPPLATAYLGNVVAGAAIMTSTNTGFSYEQGRTPVYTRDILSTGVVVGVPCFYASAASSNEEHINTTATHKVSLEDISGNITRVTFNSGNATGACSNATNGVLVSDAMTMTAPIASGQLMWFKDLYTDTTNGILLHGSGMNLDNGGGLQYSSSALTDLSGTAGPITSTGTNTQSSGNMLYPLFIATQTKVRSFLLVGTSRTAGLYDYFDGANADVGNLARSIGKFAPYTNAGLGSDQAAYFVASHAARVQLGQWHSDLILEDAINDITAGASAATIEGYLNTIRGYYSGISKVHLPTTEPYPSLTSISISALVANGNGLTATIASTARMFPGEFITISGATPPADNGPCQITQLISATQFACVNALATGTATATGTITYTDGFADPYNQTVSVNNSVLVSLNQWKRTIPSGFYSAPEISDAMTSGRDSGKWRAVTCMNSLVSSAVTAFSFNGSPTVEGLHPNHCGYLAIQQSGALSPSVLY